MMSTYRNAATGEIRDLDDELIASWQSAGNPKAAQWESFTPPPEPPPEPLPPQPRWAEFGLLVLEMPEVKGIFAQAIAAGEAPLAVGLGVALGKAADGQSALFLGIWAKAIALGLVTPELNGQVQALATAFDLPAEFIAGLAGSAQTDHVH